MKPLLAFNIGDIILKPGSKLGTTYSSTSPLITTILRNAITAAGIIFLGLLIFGGITYIINAGEGDPKKAQQGKSAITNALVGFAIILLAYSIIKVIEVITGLNILSNDSL